MNWIDYVVLGIIGAFAVAGLFRGFIMSAYRLVSFVVSTFLSIRLAPVLAGVLRGSAVSDAVRGMINSNLKAWKMTALQSGSFPDTEFKGVERVFGFIPMPEMLKSRILGNLPSPAEMTGTGGLLDSAGDELTGIIISIISLIVIYLALRLILAVIGLLLRGIAALPLFRQVNKLGGFLLGAARGVLTVYILFAVLMIFNSSMALAPVFEAIVSSKIASDFYVHNFIIKFLLPSVLA